MPRQSDPELNIPCATADKSRKSVHWKADSELAEVHYFENESFGSEKTAFNGEVNIPNRECLNPTVIGKLEP